MKVLFLKGKITLQAADLPILRFLVMALRIRALVRFAHSSLNSLQYKVTSETLHAML